MKILIPYLHHKKEAIDSLVSYSVGGGGLSVGVMASWEPQINTAILILSLIVVFIRLCYDGLKFIDYLKSRKKS